MRQNTAHIRSDGLTTLQQTAEQMEVELEEVIAGAIWAFSQQDTALRCLVVQDYWSRQLGASGLRAEAPSLKERIHELAERLFSPLRRCTAHAVAG